MAILNLFYLVSGLKLNLHKSNLYGIGLPFHRVEDMTGITGCSPACIPFSYLGLPVWANMNRGVNWNPVTQRFQKRLANWKVNLLSMGGRLALIKSILNNISIYYMCVFKMLEYVNSKL